MLPVVGHEYIAYISVTVTIDLKLITTDLWIPLAADPFVTLSWCADEPFH